MNKVFLFALLTFASFAEVNAQLKVDANGKVKIASNQTDSISLLTVGNNAYTASRFSNGIISSPIIKNKTNIGIFGNVIANQEYTNDKNFGVLGVTSVNGNHGRNFGVSGMLNFDSSYPYLGGAGVYATDYAYLLQFPDNIQGIYAAYFHGNTNLQGRTIAQEIYTPADERLSSDVESIEMKSRVEGSTLDNLLKLNVLEYNIKNQQATKEPDNIDEMTREAKQAYEFMKKDEEKMYSRRRFGLSAQELQKVYPNLVMEGQDGYLYVNYTELVPLLIQSIQELKAELNDVKGNKDNVSKSRSNDFEEGETTAANQADVIPAATLAQNTPNPFSERTTIRFTLPENTQNAFIYIFDMSGKMQKQIPVDNSMKSITIEGYELSAGMYIYSLVIGGNEIKTRRMILSK